MIFGSRLIRHSSILNSRDSFINVRGVQGVRNYHDTVHDHFNNPRNVGKMDKSDPKVGTAIVGKAACGDVVQLQIKVEEGVITDAKFKTFGCGSAIASASYATELIKGKSADEAAALRNTDISEYLKLPPVKIHCSLLVEEAVKNALDDYKSKQGSTNAKEAKL
jgi:Fe-S cluster assembly scaffold IscU